MEWNLNNAATEFHVGRDTLARELKRLGFEVKHGATYSTHDIHRALAGDWRYEKTRESRARADGLELENEKERGKLIEPEVVQERIAAALAAVGLAVLQAKAEIPSRANPQDPATARRAVEQWAARFFPFVRESIEKEDDEKPGPAPAD